MIPLMAGMALGFVKNRILGAGSAVAGKALGMVGGSPVKLIGIGVVVLVIVLGGWYIKNKIENLKEQVVSLQQEVGGYKVTVAAFENSIAVQNKAIQDLSAAGKVMEKKSILKQKEARELAKKYESDIRRLLSEDPIIETCDDGMKYLKEKAGSDLKW